MSRSWTFRLITSRGVSPRAQPESGPRLHLRAGPNVAWAAIIWPGAQTALMGRRVIGSACPVSIVGGPNCVREVGWGIYLSSVRAFLYLYLSLSSSEVPRRRRARCNCRRFTTQTRVDLAQGRRVKAPNRQKPIAHGGTSHSSYAPHHEGAAAGLGWHGGLMHFHEGRYHG